MIRFGDPLRALVRVRGGGCLHVRCRRRNGVIGECEDTAAIAVEKRSGRIIAFGSDALHWDGASEIDVIRLFAHPRLAIHDIDATEKLLRTVIARAAGETVESRLFRGRSPVEIAIHFEGGVVGGLTDVEKHALQSLKMRIGACALVWSDACGKLSDDELGELIRTAAN